MSAAGNALRGVRLLHELDELRVTGVAERLGVVRSTAHRVLAMLVAEGFAVQDRHKVHRPGPTLQAIRGTGQPHAPI
ncbi:helix-turn-helix domain-containing protein [Streptomyces sp. NPDC097610]|uniref:helix-turn-helix domain-containing protein n=1 Tax=Streptomyces sp. NPDC097610 TaxID=3157227 RepID=UPI00333054D6